MKAVKIIIGIVVVLVAAVVIMGLIAPKETDVSRTVTINAPKDFVYEYVNSFDDMNKWSPWMQLDPNMTQSVEGEDGTVGAVHHWEGNEDVGKGSQEITAMTADRIDTKLRFMEPFESEADAYVTVTGDDKTSEVTWGFHSVSPFPMNAMNLFMDMDAMLGKDFDKGLNNLKDMVETAKTERTEFDGYTVEEGELTPRTYIGMRDTVAWDKLHDYYMTNLPKAHGAVSKAKMEMAGAPSGVYFMWDEEGKQCEVLAGVPVNGEQQVDKFDSFPVSGKVLVINYYGPYEGSGNAHMAMDKYIAWHDLKQNGPVIEEYITDPQSEPDQAKWLTKIYYPVE